MAFPTPASGYEQTDQRHGITARLQVAVQPTGADLPAERVEMRLSGELVLTLSLDGRAVDVEPIMQVTTSAGWKVCRVSAPTIENPPRWEQTFTLEPQRPGSLPLHVVPLRFRMSGSSGAWEEAAWKPIPVTVTTEVARADLSELRDITPPEELPPVPPWWTPLAWIGGVLAAGAVLWILWQVRRRHSRRAAVLSPDQWALRELEHLEARGLPAAGEVERYHTLLCDTVRRYLELRFALPASQQTTAEFLEAMRHATELAPEQQTLLRDFLERCDLAKFARWQPSDPECAALATMARSFIVETSRGAVRA